MKTLKLIVLLVLSLALMGCFESIVLLRVNKDGSGTIEETVVISDSFMELMKSFGGEQESEAEQVSRDEVSDHAPLRQEVKHGEPAQHDLHDQQHRANRNEPPDPHARRFAAQGQDRRANEKEGHRAGHGPVPPLEEDQIGGVDHVGK